METRHIPGTQVKSQNSLIHVLKLYTPGGSIASTRLLVTTRRRPPPRDSDIYVIPLHSKDLAKSYLEFDYSIDCDSDRYKDTLVFVVIMIMVS